jgi:hypothetical protein
MERTAFSELDLLPEKSHSELKKLFDVTLNRETSPSLKMVAWMVRS